MEILAKLYDELDELVGYVRHGFDLWAPRPRFALKRRLRRVAAR